MTLRGGASRARLTRRLLALAAPLMLLAAPLQAAAETYRVDLIVFVDRYRSGGEAGDASRLPNLRGSIDPGDAGSLRAAGIVVLPDEQFGLAEEWQRLRNSKQFQPVMRLAWTQKDPPGERGPSLRIKAGKAQRVEDGESLGAASVNEIDGSVALLLGRYLHLDSDLVYNADGRSWRLAERRKMRREEIHHLDSPRLGLLARVTKAEPPAP